jgi:hypothetical protein
MTELAYMYFPDHYRWSHGLLHVLGAAPWGGAEIDEVHRTGLRRGFHHCQTDNVSIGTAYIWDWLEDVLAPERTPGS